MAKELPYFKFEPSAWDTGKIQLVSFELQGIFINLCSFYWQRLGNLPYKLALQKICNGNATALRQLCDEEIIDIKNELIFIYFLDEQLSEFENTSKINSKNALKGWKKRKSNAVALNSHSDRNAIREEKRREEKIIKENKFNFKKSLIELGIEEKIVSDWLKVRTKKKSANTETAFNGIKSQIEKSVYTPNECIKIAVENSWSGFKSEWVNNNFSKKIQRNDSDFD